MRRNLIYVIATLVVVLGAFIATLITDTRPPLGLDLQGGISITLEPKGDPAQDALDTAVEVIRSRVDAIGIAEPDIRREGDNIVVDLPGVDDADRARALVGQTAVLQFRPVLRCFVLVDPADLTTTTTAPAGETTTSVADGGAGETTTSVAGGGPGESRPRQAGDAPSTTVGITPADGETTTTAGDGTASDGAAPAAPIPVPPAGTFPADASGCEYVTPELAPSVTPVDERTPEATVVLPTSETTRGKDEPLRRYQLGPTGVDGKGIDSSATQAQLGNTGWVVAVDFTKAGNAAWNAIAGQLYGKPPPTNQLGIVLDGEVISAPTIQEPSYPDGATISGNFDETEAKDFARLLRYGALPIELAEANVSDISPTLGSEQLTAGIVAAVIGVGLVFLYLLAFYRILGLVAVMGVTLSFLATWVVASVFGAVLTLAGVVGLIVSVGVTVDSYIVYFERLKDEVRKGKTVRSSLTESYRSSWRTIVTADLVSLIGAAALYFIAVGGVRGFAFFLGLSTLLDLIVSWTFMYPLVALLCRRPGIVEARWIGVGSGLDTKDRLTDPTPKKELVG